MEFVIGECGIRQLHARFTDAVWRKDQAAFAACFSSDAAWKIAGMRFEGRDQIATAFGNLLGRCERVRLISETPLLEIEGASAKGRLPVTEMAKMPDGSAALTLGVYHDHYVNEGDCWRFSWRHFALHYRGPFEMPADMVASPDYGLFPAMPEDEEVTLTTLKKT
ncbi:nuclear transport factor 2 family protein [Zhongshania aquimaris]|uniref:Nuclear transport factor 2 family protein n=1 Tax=Zhongshania aquimaris TaxID=2857107 RepID=A0ABS6VYI4_9GAMM|nr:nuclear transport factor 2 family protein [Zhongshania aquimaris]MBW2942701.1 nuclear transport factor 2 family protein [Zhongshania aquimaris]